MRPFKHFVISTVGGAAVYGLTGSVSSSVAMFFTGWLIDVDHLFEYIRDNGCDFNVKRFWGYFYEHHSIPEGRKLYFFFHSHEIAIILVLLCFLSKLNLTLSFATLGYILHLLCDQFANRILPLGYFFVYRLIKGFDKWFVLSTVQTRISENDVKRT